MTVDERFERIENKLQGITEALEVLASMQRDNEARFVQVTKNFEITLDSIKRLENIAGAHEHRIDRLEEDR